MKPGKIIFKGKINDLDLIIRYPLMDDLKSLWDYINDISKEQTFIRYQGEEISLEEEKKFLRDQLEKMKNKTAIFLVALLDGKIAGTSGIVMRDKTEKHVGSFGITIARDFRGKGIGKKLMEVVLRQAQENIPQLGIVTLAVYANNPVAWNLYKSLGFKEYGRLPRGLFYKNEFVDEILMYQTL